MTVQNETLDDLQFLRADGSVCRLTEFAGKPMLLVFLRHLACIACQAHLGEVQRRWADFDALGVVVLGVAHSSVEVLRFYLQSMSWSFEIVTDPERRAYSRLELRRTSIWDYFRPRVIAGYLRIMLSGWRVRRPFGGEDLHQLGGDFVLDRQHRLRFAWRSSDPLDRPTIEQILDRFRRIHAEVESGKPNLNAPESVS